MSKLMLRGFAQRKVRALLTGIAIVLGVALMAGTYILTDTINHAFAEVFGSAYKNKAVVVTAKETLGHNSGSQTYAISEATLASVRAVPGVAAASGAISTRATLLTTSGKRITGTAPSIVDAVQPVRFEAFTAAKGQLPRAADEVAIDQATAERDHLRLGQQLVIAGSAPARRYTISGIAKFAGSESFGGTSVALLLPGQAQYVAGEPGEYDSINVAASPGRSPEQLASSVRAALPATLIVRTGAQEAANQTSELEEVIKPLRTFLLVFAYVALLVGAFIIFNTFSITVAQRVREFGLLRTLGASRRQIMRAVVEEGLLLGIAGSVVGLLAGVVVALRIFVGGGVAVVALVVIAVRALRLRARLKRGGERPPRHYRVIPALGRAIGLIVSWRGITGHLARENSVRQPGRTLVTALALTVGLGLVAFISVLAAGTKATIDQAVSRSFAGSLIVQNTQTGEGGIPAAIAPALRSIQGVGSVTAIAFTEGRVRALDEPGAPVIDEKSPLTAIEPESFRKMYKVEWEHGSAATLATLAQGGTVLTKKFANAHHLRVGQRLLVLTSSGHRVTLTVRGIIKEEAIGLMSNLTISRPRRERDGSASRHRRAAAQQLPPGPLADGGAIHARSERKSQQAPPARLRAARAVGARLPARDREHAGPLDLRAHARARDDARDRRLASPDPPDDSLRVADHRSDRGCARPRDRRRRGGARERAHAVRIGLRALDPGGHAGVAADRRCARRPARRAAPRAPRRAA
jgi:putative ABC transport system permease protein